MECHEQLAMNGDVQDKVETQESRQVSPEPDAEKCDETQVIETWHPFITATTATSAWVCIFMCRWAKSRCRRYLIEPWARMVLLMPVRRVRCLGVVTRRTGTYRLDVCY